MQTYPSPEIQQMKDRGYDRVAIAAAEETLVLRQAMQDIQTQIQTAFADVILVMALAYGKHKALMIISFRRMFGFAPA